MKSLRSEGMQIEAQGIERVTEDVGKQGEVYALINQGV